MKRDMDCIGFEAPRDIVLLMRQALAELQEMSPSDSYVDAQVAQKDGNYHLSLQIKHAGGEFVTQAKGEDLALLITKGANDIIQQIRKWQQLRLDGIDGSVSIAPANRQTNYPVTDKCSDYFSGFRALIVDDDLESVTPLSVCLETMGCEIKIVTNGFEAIHELVSSGCQYDLVILDWMMPEMDGKQTLLNAQRVISFSPAVNQHRRKGRIPVVTFSGHAREEINLPECEDFIFLDHWKKQTAFTGLLEQAKRTFAEVQKLSDI